MAEGARLESVYTATYRGFEPLSHRQHFKEMPEHLFRHFFLRFLFIKECIKKPGRSRVLRYINSIELDYNQRLTVSMQRTLAERRTYTIPFAETDNANHLVLFETR